MLNFWQGIAAKVKIPRNRYSYDTIVSVFAEKPTVFIIFTSMENFMLSEIKELCKKRGISINELESEIGLGINTIYKWDKASPSADKLQRVADYFGVSLDFLTGRELRKPPVEQQIGELMAEIAFDKFGFKSQFIRSLAAIPPEGWPQIERFIDSLAALREKENQELISSDKKE